MGMFPTMFRLGRRRRQQDNKRVARPDPPPRKKFRPLLEALETRALLSFAAPVSYNVGTQPDSFIPNAAPIGVATGDFNGDGKRDLVVAHGADNSVYILLGNGNGTFQTAVKYAIGQSILGNVFVGDFNNDGKQDLFLISGASGNPAIVLLGHGDGTFGTPIVSSSFNGPPNTYPRGWTIGDFNGDGKLDAVCTNPSNSSDSGGYTVLLGNGDGTFQAGLVGPMVLGYSRWVTTGDFNGDGKLDLATADGQQINGSPGNAELSILLGNGDGTFHFGGHYASPGLPSSGNLNPEDVAVGDVNGDGKLDAIVSDYDDNINVFLGNGDGTFQPAKGVSPGEYPRDVAIADVNGDGKADLVVTDVGIYVGGAQFSTEGTQPGSVSVLLGNGDGTFQAPIQYQPFVFPGWTAVADFNGDGSPDLATTRVFDGHTVNVMLNQSANTNLPPTVATAASATPSPVTGTTTNLSVLGADDGGEANITYTWATIGTVPASVTFSANGTNAAKNTTATFTKAGTYPFAVTLTDAGGLSAIATVTVTVNQTLTSITVSPASASVAFGVSQPFTASALDQFGTALSTQPSFTWAVSGGGTISSTGLFTAGTTTSGVFTVTASSGSTSGTASVTVGNTGTLTVYSLAGDGRVGFNGSSGGGQAGWDTVHDSATGNYVDSTGVNAFWVGSLLNTNVLIMRGFLPFDTSALPDNAVITGATLGLFVTGKSDAVNDGMDFVTVVQGFQASSSSLTGADYSKAGDAIDNPTEGTNRVDITGIPTNAYQQWTFKSIGMSWISTTGVTLLAAREGHDVLDSLPGYQNTQSNLLDVYMSEQPGTSQDPYLQITYYIPSGNNPPTVATPAAASPSPVGGKTTNLSVLGADDGGEANLTYTWTNAGTPPAPVTFSANGTNAAKNTTATFTKAGVYNFQVTITDTGGLTTTSNVSVTVNQTLTSLTVSPPNATVASGGTQPFIATARDQFGTTLVTSPTVTWTASGGGAIDGTGLFTAGASAGGPFTITAASGGVSGTAAVLVTTNAHPSTVQFSAAGYSVAENAGSVVITVTRGGDTSDVATVQYATSDGTAHAGSDYTAVTGTLTFGPGETSKTLLISFSDNGLADGDKTVQLTVSNANGTTLASPSTATLTITESDIPSVPDGPPSAHLLDVARAFAHSLEHYTQFVTHAYAQYLKRTPDAAGLAAWVSGMQAGTYSDEQVEALFLGSQEYIANHGGTGQAWVTGMYQDLLGRTPSAAEVQNWVNALNSGTPASAVALGFAASQERETQRVVFNYQTYLGRAPRQDEIDLWVNGFLGGMSNEDMVAGFVGSLEYYLKTTKGNNNEARWIAQGYLDVLFRPAATSEINFWLTNLDS
jgi:hypothetical protein